jgi:DNA-binding response OmpR family regulator
MSINRPKLMPLERAILSLLMGTEFVPLDMLQSLHTAESRDAWRSSRTINTIVWRIRRKLGIEIRANRSAGEPGYYPLDEATRESLKDLLV